MAIETNRGAAVAASLAAAISHELRGPLNAMMGWLHILREAEAGSKASADAFGGLDQAVQQQLRLVSELIDFSQLEAEKLQLNRAPTRLAPVIEAALRAASGPAEAKSIRLTLSSKGEDQVTLADAARLEQVMSHLISNAIKFTSRGGEVTVEVVPRGTDVEIAVGDNGCGIAPDHLARLFQAPFDKTGSRSGGGLGLGLAIVRQLVELHGGRVRADSDGPGRGARFTVALPLASAGERV